MKRLFVLLFLTLAFVSGCGVHDGPSLLEVVDAPSVQAGLSSLTVSSGTLTKLSDVEYVVSVPNGSPSVTITPSLLGAGTSITINGATVASGTPSNSITLPVGLTEVPAVVTLPDNTTQNITIRIGRNAPIGITGYRSLGSVMDAQYPYGGIRLHPNGHTLYAFTYGGGSAGGGAIFKIEADGSGYSVIYNFANGGTDPRRPYGDPTFSADGNTIYGTTEIGGTASRGAIFKINSDGTGFTVLHSFDWFTGQNPHGSLILSGNTLYGMTTGGNSNGSDDFGVIFKIQTDGTGFQLLKEFANSDGSTPEGSVLLYQNKLYGMTSGGGSSNKGVIFSLNTDGTSYQVLHHFTGSATDGEEPLGSLVEANGMLYGFSRYGGTSGNGSVFSIAPDGTQFSVIHSFTNTGLRDPRGTPAISWDRTKLYGFTKSKSTANFNGGMFSLNLDGTGYTEIHSNAGAPTDASYFYYGAPFVIADTIFGMSEEGGANDAGFIFAFGL